MESVAHISSPLTETWVAWLMLLVFTLVVLTGMFKPHTMKQTLRALFSVKDRSSSFFDLSSDMRACILLSASYLLLLSFVAYVLLYLMASGVQPTFDVVNYLIVLGVVLGVYLVKTLVSVMVAYVFQPAAKIRVFVTQYFYVVNTAALLLYPTVLLALFATWLPPMWAMWMLGVVLSLLVMLLLMKMFRVFVRNIRDVLYVLIFLLTCEVLPLGIAFVGLMGYLYGL